MAPLWFCKPEGTLAILTSVIALYVVSQQKMSAFRACSGSILMGGGIASMHYIGMLNENGEVEKSFAAEVYVSRSFTRFWWGSKTDRRGRTR
jgi:hypothetical protein